VLWQTTESSLQDFPCQKKKSLSRKCTVLFSLMLMIPLLRVMVLSKNLTRTQSLVVSLLLTCSILHSRPLISLPHFLLVSFPRFLLASLPCFILVNLPCILLASLPCFLLVSLPCFLLVSIPRFQLVSLPCTIPLCHLCIIPCNNHYTPLNHQHCLPYHIQQQHHPQHHQQHHHHHLP